MHGHLEARSSLRTQVLPLILPYRPAWRGDALPNTGTRTCLAERRVPVKRLKRCFTHASVNLQAHLKHPSHINKREEVLPRSGLGRHGRTCLCTGREVAGTDKSTRIVLKWNGPECSLNPPCMIASPATSPCTAWSHGRLELELGAWETCDVLIGNLADRKRHTHCSRKTNPRRHRRSKISWASDLLTNTPATSSSGLIGKET